MRPGLDDKVLADWNGLMIAGLVNAGVSLDEPAWVQRAARAFLFVDAKMAHGDRLGHSWRDGRLLFPGLASDHAAMIRSALALQDEGPGGVGRAAPALGDEDRRLGKGDDRGAGHGAEALLRGDLDRWAGLRRSRPCCRTAGRSGWPAGSPGP